MRRVTGSAPLKPAEIRLLVRCATPALLADPDADPAERTGALLFLCSLEQLGRADSGLLEVPLVSSEPADQPPLGPSPS